jgi:hypothetical protein
MSSSCVARANAAAKGPCNRPDATVIEKGDCNSQNTDGRCNAEFGTKDGSTWCADPDWGCCKRTGAPAVNTLACCLGQKTSFADCGDSWCPLSDACVPALGAYCGAGPEHVTENICRTFCAEPSNKPYCDAAMTQYCDAQKAAGVKDDLCACIWASEAEAIAPACFDAQCNATGYKTDAQFKASLTCPTYCPQVVGCWNTGTCTANNNLVKTYCCGADYPDACGAPSGGGGGGGGNFVQRFLDFWLSSTRRKIIGGAILATAIVCMLVLVFLAF